MQKLHWLNSLCLTAQKTNAQLQGTDHATFYNFWNYIFRDVLFYL